MNKYRIQGGKVLKGDISVSGAKNAALAIMAGAVLTEERVVLENIPDIADTKNLVTILRQMNVKVDYEDPHTLVIDASEMRNDCVDSDEVRKMRASYYLLGSMLGRFRHARVAFPGGCDFGSRPIDQHIKGFEALGATVDARAIIEMHADELKGAGIFLDVVSVGATINVMLAAVLAEGTTVIENVAKEPHVVDCANFLNSMGANIKGAGTDVIRIQGVKKLHGSRYAIIPDQIEAGTYMVAAVATGGDVTIHNVIPRHLECISAKLREMGATIENGDDAVHVVGAARLSPIRVKTLPYPGFPTDMQPQMMSLLSTVPGQSSITEGVFESRFRYVEQLRHLGAQIDVRGQLAAVNGVSKLVGSEVKALDLRAGAAMVVAGLMAEGETVVTNVELVDRGYESLVEKLTGIGACIKRVNED